MKVLVDTSVWSLALRRREHAQNPQAEELGRLIASHVVQIIGPIRQEVLSGVRDSAQFERLEACLNAFVRLSKRSGKSAMLVSHVLHRYTLAIFDVFYRGKSSGRGSAKILRLCSVRNPFVDILGHWGKTMP